VVLVPIQQIVGGWNNPAIARVGFVRDRWTVAVALGYGSLCSRHPSNYGPYGRSKCWNTRVTRRLVRFWRSLHRECPKPG